MLYCRGLVINVKIYIYSVLNKLILMGNTYATNNGSSDTQLKKPQLQPSHSHANSNTDAYGSVERSHAHCEQHEQMKKTLKFLYKNNFVSLTFVSYKLI